MGEILKNQHGNIGNGWPHRGRNPAAGLAESGAFRVRRAFCPVSRGLSGRCQPRHALQVVSPRHEVTLGLAAGNDGSGSFMPTILPHGV